jgi:hypothetical protein
MNNKREYSFMYMGQEVRSGSEIVFRGEYFDEQGNRYYKGYWPCTFLYKQDGKFYIEVDGKTYYHNNLARDNIYHFKKLNGKKMPNPVTEDDVKAGTILLLIIMAVTSIFKGNVFLWIIELIVYFNWVNHKKYD